jgi:signal recognition particle GTPase
VANRRQRSRKSTFDGRRLVERLEKERTEKERTEKVPSIRKEQMTLDDFLERAIMKIVDEGKIYERLKELCEGVTSKYSLRIYR